MKSHSKLTQVRSQTVKPCVYGTRGYGGNCNAKRLKLIPHRFAEIEYKCLGRVIALNTRHCHPGAHGTHIQNTPVSTLLHGTTKEAGHINHGAHMQVKHEVHTLLCCVHKVIEEKHTGVVYKHLYLITVILAEIKQFLRRIFSSQIHI